MKAQSTISGADWRIALVDARSRPNVAAELIHRKLSMTPSPAIPPVLQGPIKFTPPPAPTGMNLPRFLHQLAIAESGNTWRKVGTSGERSPYQISKIVWTQHMPAHLRFEHYCGSEHYGYMARECAEKHIAWLSGLLRQRSLAVNPINLATVWHLGFGRGVKEIHARRWCDEGIRVSNLYEAAK